MNKNNFNPKYFIYLDINTCQKYFFNIIKGIKIKLLPMNEFQFTTVTVPKLEWDKLLNTMDVLNEKVSKLVTKHDKELLTKKEVMQLLKIGRTTLDRYIDEGILTEVKLEKGKRGYIKYSQITDLMHKENKKR